MQLSDIRPGDEIEYIYYAGRQNFKRRIGKVVQVTPRFISLQGERYPDTILVNDLLVGTTMITKFKKGEEVFMVKGRPIPNKSEMLTKAKEMINSGATIRKAAQAVGVPPTTLHTWITKEEKQQANTTEPVQPLNQEQELGETELIENSMPRKAATINEDWENVMQEMVAQNDSAEEKYEPADYCRGTVHTATGESYPIGDWTPQDEQPIPYKLVESYDLTEIKLALIEKVIDSWRLNMPGKVALALVNQIIDMEVVGL